MANVEFMFSKSVSHCSVYNNPIIKLEHYSRVLKFDILQGCGQLGKLYVTGLSWYSWVLIVSVLLTTMWKWAATSPFS